ncbi:MAG: ABC transporter ATP-binding protein [Rhodospirillales bacterium]|nr:ABC transporter ATP-binding protein [Rhodospirillales bacterium]
MTAAIHPLRQPPPDRATAPLAETTALAGLRVAGIGHSFGAKRAVDDVTLAVAPGELVCLVGPSGCGKTTLLRVVAGLEAIQQGSIVIDGCAVAEPGYGIPPEARGVGMVFQDYALFPHLDVAGNIAFGLAHLPAATRAVRVREALGQVGMVDYAKAWPHQLSGGQQQRVALARALAPKPRVMLLDEPFSGLDTRLREQIRDDTLHVLKKSGAATLMVTHDPEEAMFMADRIVVMRDGGVEQAGRPAEIYSHPANAFVATFFGQVNEIRGRVQGGTVTTPFGPVPAVDFADGAAVDVLIRPEGLKLNTADDGPGCPAKVLAARLLGRSSWIHLSLGRANGERAEDPTPDHFHARVPGRYLPREGEVLAVALDSAQVFVFAAGEHK